MTDPSDACAEPLLKETSLSNARIRGKTFILLLVMGLGLPALLILVSCIHVESEENLAAQEPVTTMDSIGHWTEQAPPPPSLFDAGCTSITLVWPPIDGAKRYAVEYRPAALDEKWLLASEKLKEATIEQKDLKPDTAYEWRIAGRDALSFSPWSSAANYSTLCEGTPRLEPPRQSASDTESLTLEWDAPSEGADRVDTYHLQVMTEGEAEWITVSESIKQPTVRKKKLESGRKYAFRVKTILAPKDDEDSPANYTFSRPSEWMSVQNVAPFFLESFGDTLINKQGTTFPTTCLAGKVVGVLASAAW